MSCASLTRMAAGGKPAVSAAGYSHYSLHIGVRTFAAFGDEALEPRSDNGQRYRAKLGYRIVESAEIGRASCRERV